MSATIDTATSHGVGPELDPSAPRRASTVAPRWTGPVAGLLAAAAALTVGWLVAAIADATSPFVAVGNAAIDATPPWLKDRAIDWFGTSNKTALRVGMVAVIALLAAAAGALGRVRRWVGPVTMGSFAVLGASIAATRPGQGSAAVVASIAAGVVGAVTVWWLTSLAAANDGPRDRPSMSVAPDGWDRRRFMVSSASIAGAAVGAGLAAHLVERRRDDRTAPLTGFGSIDAATIVSAAPTVPDSATVSPITPFITPTADFYRIDTALSVPRVNLDRWALEIGGMVDRPLRLSYADLLARPHVERHITIACVSNEVGGGLIGTATWQGVLLADLLAEAGVRPGAEQLFATSVDGWTCGFPVEAALDGRDALVALGMNGEPLPRRHGFPARVIVPGLYGYVSATKWISRLDATTWDAEEGYWIPRGWAREAPIKTQSRIDVPRRGEPVASGPVAIAGVAWAPQRGVSRVEVRIDDGNWVEARLVDDVSDDTWRQWVYEWQADPGDHVVRVRATDGSGVTQTDEVAPPDPDGATGYHTRRVIVE